MAIEGIVFDLSDTLLDRAGVPVQGIPQLFSDIKSRGLKLVVVSNDNNAEKLLQAAELETDIIVTSRDVGKRKPSPLILQEVMKLTDLNLNKLVYVGDNDRTDAFCAANAKMLYLCAGWVDGDPKYGIKIDTPEALLKYIKIHLQKENYWYFSLEKTDDNNRQINMYSLLDCRSNTDSGKMLKETAVNVLKKGFATDKLFLMNQLFASIYLDDMPDDLDLWTTWPGHGINESINKVMSPFLMQGAKEFKDKYYPLFIRHKKAVKSAYARAAGNEVSIGNQIETVHIQPAYKDSIVDKSILVIDDFSTRSLSFEWARNLLLQAGAKKVISVSVGKFRGNSYWVYTPKEEVSWDPFSPCTLDENKFNCKVYRGNINIHATEEIENLYEANKTELISDE